jgi:hypothetical protein
MEAGINSVIYMGLISGPNKADDTCGRTTVTGTTDRGFTVFLMGKFNSKVEQLESRTVSWNGLCSKFEVPLYLLSSTSSAL